MNEQQQELNERIADDERHAATMRRAADYDALLANANADGDQGMTERQIVELSRVYLALIEAHGLNIEAARNVIDRALKQAAAVLEIFGSAEAAARFEGNDTSARAKAAEAERNTAARRAFNAEADNQRLTAENRRLAARVAELEAELAAQWRPVTEDWPPYNERVIIGYGGGYGGGWCVFARRVRTDEDAWLMDDDTMLAFESAAVAMPRPLPPAPQETE